MPVVSRVEGDKVIITLSVSFKFSDHEAFRKAALGHPPGTKFEIDFGDIEQIDSASIGMLLLLRTAAGEAESDISLTNCRPNVLKLFRMCKFGDIFHLS